MRQPVSRTNRKFFVEERCLFCREQELSHGMVATTLTNDCSGIVQLRILISKIAYFERMPASYLCLGPTSFQPCSPFPLFPAY